VIAIDWLAPPEQLTLSSTAVHIWRGALNLAEAEVSALGSVLNADEQARARRLRFDDKRRAFVAARGILRTILGRYLGLPPQQVCFSYNAHGKPELAVSQAAGLQFNLAHSGDLVLVALAHARPVGIDLERHHPVEAVGRLVDRYFAPAERAAFRQLPPEQWLPAFFAGWTRKEAYLKARGEGLTLPLNEFEVTLTPGEAPALLADRHSLPNSAPWVLVEVEAGPGYTAALAVPGPVQELAAWQWSASN
jgi:4'-phosphopantetheinyl transferase